MASWCVANASPSACKIPNTHRLRPRRAATDESSWRMEPAATLRGLANSGSPWAARSSFKRAKRSLGMYTSPRTSRNATEPRSCSGRARMVFRFSVTSSPTTPSPRVEPRTNTPSRYSRETDRPSILGSRIYSAAPTASRTRRSKARISSWENASCMLSMGTWWRTCSNFSSTAPPTRCVGDAGDAYCGYACSSSVSSRMSLSYS